LRQALPFDGDGFPRESFPQAVPLLVHFPPSYDARDVIVYSTQVEAHIYVAIMGSVRRPCFSNVFGHDSDVTVRLWLGRG
jgi:hypothetical protein